MRIKKILAASALTFLVLITPVQKASAHVLIEDTTGKTGAILHISPNDDPVASETASIFYDIQTPIDLNKAAVHLQITNDTGTISESVVMNRSKNTTSGAFIFPTRGLYYLELTISKQVGGPNITPLTFRYPLRITQSKANSTPKPELPAWVTFGLIMSVWGLTATIMLFIFRRKEIYAQSK